MGILSRKYRKQFLVTICVNINTIGLGAVCGWPSPNFPILQSDKTPLASGPMTIDEVSWVGALLCLGSLCGSFFLGWFTNKYGRKIPMLIAAVPALIGWILILIATNPTYLYVSRFLAGISGAAADLMTPIFISEISGDTVRGTFCSMLMLASNFGMLLAFVIGNYVDYTTSTIIFLIIPIIFLCTFIYFPESPHVLFKNAKFDECRKSLEFYRNVNEDNKQEFGPMIVDEINKFQSCYANNDLEPIRRSNVTWRDFTTPAARKALLIGVVLAALINFSGCFAMLNYTDDIFTQSGSNISPGMAAIIVGIIQLIGANFSTALVDKAGRRFMLISSALGTAFGLIVFGVFTRLNQMGYSMDGFKWIPVTSFSFTIFIYNWGILTLPFVVIAEIMPEKIRSYGTSFCTWMIYVTGFIMLKCFPLFAEVLGIDGVMFMFACCCLAGAFFVLMVVPETNGKSLEEIIKLLENK